MSRLFISVLALSATPALAHPGTHLHPHGPEAWFWIALAMGFIALTAVLLLVRR